MMSDALDLAHSDVTMLDNGVLTRVHSPIACAGEHCWVHNPSPTQMVSWPVRWRADKRTAERICPHKIGHPDLDDVDFNARCGRDVTAHGCDGCCATVTDFPQVSSVENEEALRIAILGSPQRLGRQGCAGMGWNWSQSVETTCVRTARRLN